GSDVGSSDLAPDPISSEPLPAAAVPPVGQTPPSPQQADVPDPVDSSAPQHDSGGEPRGQFQQTAHEPAPAPEPATDPLPPVVPPVSETPPQQWGHPQPPASPASGWEHTPAPQTHAWAGQQRSEEYTSELQSRFDLVCR